VLKCTSNIGCYANHDETVIDTCSTPFSYDQRFWGGGGGVAGKNSWLYLQSKLDDFEAHF
jgi:hypothetical protein